MELCRSDAGGGWTVRPGVCAGGDVMQFKAIAWAAVISCGLLGTAKADSTSISGDILARGNGGHPRDHNRDGRRHSDSINAEWKRLTSLSLH